IVARRSERGRRDVGMQRERLPDGCSLYRLLAGVSRVEHFLEYHQRVEQLFTLAIMESRPDVVHINHLWGLSPGFGDLAPRLGAAVVISLHDFYFACPRVHLHKPGGGLCDGPDDGHECVRTCFTSGFKEDRLRRWGYRSVYFRRVLSMAERTICYSQY